MRGVAVLAGLTFGAIARADGASLDIEVVRPSFSLDAAPGVDVVPGRSLGVTWGAVAQYEKNPLIYRSYSQTGEARAGSVITHRVALDLGARFDVSSRLAFRAVFPVAANDGGGSVAGAADRAGLRDASVGASVRVVGSSLFALGFRADLAVPIGTRDAWLGERVARLGGGLVGSAQVGRVDVSAQLGATARRRFDTGFGFSSGSDGWFGASGRVRVAAPIDVMASTSGRVDILAFQTKDPPMVVEVAGGGRWRVGGRCAVDLMVGRGFGRAPGATDLRVTAAFQCRSARRTPVAEAPEAPSPSVPAAELPERSFEIEGVDPVALDATASPLLATSNAPAALVLRVGSRLEVRDPIQFEVNTYRVLPASIPTLQAIAEVLGPDDLLVIEGHASEEGALRHNYELSVGRARAIYETLLRAGIPAERLAYRAFGEVGPRSGDASEDRRVNFYVVHLAEAPPAPPAVTLPWDGTLVPSRSAPPAPEGPR
jgi:outer membrane protein OmpA-like peptidoglycan-associated protein